MLLSFVYRNAQHKKVPGRALLGHVFPSLPISSEFDLEGLPNRNSLVYISDYDIPKEPLRTFVRGTLRYVPASNTPPDF